MIIIRSLRWVRNNIGIFLVSGLAIYLVFTKLGYSLLQPWDEAWYAVIARNIVNTGNLLDLSYNGFPFWDHPTLGFYSIALSFKLFGINEFTARLPMAIFAVLTTILIYKTGEKIGNKYTGFVAALILLSSRWYLIRVRSANLESLFLLMQLLVFYFAYTANKKSDIQKLWFFFSLSLMVKTFVSVTLLPIVLLSTFNYYKKSKNGFSFFNLAILFFGPLLTWYGYNLVVYGYPFLYRNVFVIGMKEGTTKAVTIDDIKRTLLYFRSAVNKWYLPTIVSSALGIFFIKERGVRWLLGYLFLVGFPYYISSRSEVWHLLPIIVPAAILIPHIYMLLVKQIFKKGVLYSMAKNSIVPAVCLIAFISIKSYWPALMDNGSMIFEADIAKAASKNNLPLALQDDTFLPTMVFYANKNISVIRPEINPDTVLERPYQVIARKFVLEKYNCQVEKYRGDIGISICE